jgi:hypothetical protein
MTLLETHLTSLEMFIFLVEVVEKGTTKGTTL